MGNLSKEDKEVILDFYFHCGSQEHIDRGRDLIAGNLEAAELYAQLEVSLKGLDSIKYEPCPDNLVELTVARLKQAADASQARLTNLLSQEQSKKVTNRSRFWVNMGEMLATAAVILFFASVFIPSLNMARQKSWQQLCGMQLQRIFQGVNSYTNEHDGQLPSVASVTGSPWWKVGYQGSENHSNTRNMWLLVKDGYVDHTDFVCPGKRQGRVLQFDPTQAQYYNDFPARKYVTYSFRIICPNTKAVNLGEGSVLMSDLNPIFEKLPNDYSQQLRIKLTKQLFNTNSCNHNRKGQNVLFGDGSFRFTKSRQIGISSDDIFTLQNTDVYQGTELPTCETDAFLAP